MAKVRIGFVGVGSMGQVAHLANYKRIGDVAEVVALAELRPELGERVGSRFEVPGVYRDAERMLESEQLDAIVAPQQFTRHLQVIAPLYRFGLPIFTEKPLAMSTAVAERLVGQLDASSTPFHMLGFHKRADPAVVRAKAFISGLQQSGAWGDLRYARMTMAGDGWDAGAFDDLTITDEPLPPAEDDEPRDDEYVSFINFYVHQVNLLRHLMGQTYSVDYADRAGRLLVGSSAEGVPVTLEMAPWGDPGWDESVVLGFDRGWVRVTLPPPLTSRRAGVFEAHGDHGAGEGVTTVTPQLPPLHAMLEQARAFVSAVRGDTEPPCEAHDSLEDHRIADQYFAAKGR